MFRHKGLISDFIKTYKIQNINHFKKYFNLSNNCEKINKDHSYFSLEESEIKNVKNCNFKD